MSWPKGQPSTFHLHQTSEPEHQGRLLAYWGIELEQSGDFIMTIPFKLDYVIDKTIQPQLTGLQRTLNALAGVNLSVIEARQTLPCIQDHKWYVSEQLGRDIGWRVAAIDYFENIYQSRGEFSRTTALKEKLSRWAKYLGGLYVTHEASKARAGGQ